MILLIAVVIACCLSYKMGFYDGKISKSIKDEKENNEKCWLPQTAFNSDICMACGKHRNEH